MNFSSDKLRPFVDVTSLKFRGGIPLKYSFNYDINYASTKVNPRHNVSLIIRGCVLIIARRNVNQLLSTLTIRDNFYSNNRRKEFKLYERPKNCRTIRIEKRPIDEINTANDT